jgi:CHAT domain-containing protein
MLWRPSPVCLPCCATFPAAAQDTRDTRIKEIYRLFHQGQVKTAANRLRTEVDATTDVLEKARLQRDLIEICATGADWVCVERTLQEFLTGPSADPQLKALSPGFGLYLVRLMRWQGREELARNFQGGGLPTYDFANFFSHPSAIAEIQLTLAGYHAERNNLRRAEEHISHAILGLLLTDRSNSYSICKILVLLIEVLLQGQDIIGASALADQAYGYLSATLSPTGVFYAHFKLVFAHLLSYSNNYAAAAGAFLEAASLYEKLEIDPDRKSYQIASALNLAAVALVLDGKIAEAAALHARHPLQQSKEIITAAQFDGFEEFFFSVTEIFLNTAQDRPSDPRWQSLLEKPLPWQLSDLQSKDFNSYRDFALGAIGLASADKTAGQKRIVEAASARIDIFESVARSNFEGFFLPNFVDKIVIQAGLAQAAILGGDQAKALMLRASEVLVRNFRHSLVDVAALLASQPDANARRNVHSYVHLLSAKRQWELERIRLLLTGDPASLQRGDVIQDYRVLVSSMTKLKGRLVGSDGFRSEWKLPTVETLQQALPAGQAFVTYFPMFGALGKLCVRKDAVVAAWAPYEASLLQHIKLMSDAVSEQPGNDPFPSASAARVGGFLFRGLEECLPSGTHITVALPSEFASIPLGALLKPETTSDALPTSYRDARWLIKDYSFSVVISGTHFLATSIQAADQPPSRRFLGIGDPRLPKERMAGVSQTRGLAKGRNGKIEFDELPETASELRAVASLVGGRSEDVLVGEQGTEERFRAKPLEEYEIIHFATHGLLKDETLGLPDSALLLTSGNDKDSFDDGVLFAGEIAQLSLRARLVVLSACNTARYDIANVGRGVQDLQAAFAVAGSPSLLGSLWPVDSLTTQPLITHFFREWASTNRVGAAEALSKAVRTFITASPDVHQHPYYWAPFVIVGNGNVQSSSAVHNTNAQQSMRVIGGLEAGGEILRVATVKNELVYTMIAEWDGKKMNGIVGRRSMDGQERWRVSSRDVGAFGIAGDKAGNHIYVAGGTTEANPVPVLRTFTADGRQLWEVRLDHLRGYDLSNPAVTADGIAVAAIPRFLAREEAKELFVLTFDSKGKQLGSTPIQVDADISSFGASAFATMLNDRTIAVAVNYQGKTTMKFDKAGVFGLPEPCQEDRNTKVYEVERSSMKLLRAHAIKDFRAASVMAMGTETMVGGELLESCSLFGVAALFRTNLAGTPTLMWKDDDIFNSSVKGMVRSDGRLTLAVGHERRIGIRDRKSVAENELVGNKRWGDDSATRRDVSIVFLSSDGKQVSRRYQSAGLSLFVHGIEIASGRPIVYGSLGGMPALSGADELPSRTSVAGKSKTQGRPQTDWKVDVFRPN